jgi:hypothetical protein
VQSLDDISQFGSRLSELSGLLMLGNLLILVKTWDSESSTPTDERNNNAPVSVLVENDPREAEASELSFFIRRCLCFCSQRPRCISQLVGGVIIDTNAVDLGLTHSSQTVGTGVGC